MSSPDWVRRMRSSALIEGSSPAEATARVPAAALAPSLRRWSHGGRPGRHHRRTAIGQPVRTLPGGTGRGLDVDGVGLVRAELMLVEALEGAHPRKLPAVNE
jgi:hypothetical protein